MKVDLEEGFLLMSTAKREQLQILRLAALNIKVQRTRYLWIFLG